MNKLKFIKGKAIPFAAILSAMLFVPSAGMLSAHASVQSTQQQESVSGTVIDKTGEAVIGASVIVVGAQQTTGTVTDFDGNFTLNVKPGTQLKISFVGYKEQIVKAANGMKVTLEEESTMLQGVEIVAYGVQKKVTVTGALSSVKAEELTRTPVSSVNNVLAGQLSGVTTVQTSGEPGADAAQVFVRGQGTWGDSSPLIQVDGVEREMWDIDPNEIESVTVLKDASATAVFGVRGANGVVLITTKRGAEGKAHISATASFSALTPTKMVEMASSYDYAMFHNAMHDNDGTAHEFSQTVIDMFKNNTDPIRFPSMNWSDYIMKDVTLQTQHNVNISGGNKTVKYFISAGMFTQDGIFNEFDRPYDFGYGYSRFNYRSNLDIDVTKTTRLSFNISGKVDNSDKPHSGQSSDQLVKEVYWATPFSSPGFVDGKYIVNSNSTSDNYTTVEGDNAKTIPVLPFTGGTPMAYCMSQPGAFQYNNNKLQMDLVLDQNLDFITKGLSVKLKGSYNSSFATATEITNDASTYTAVFHRGVNESGNIYEEILYRKAGDDTTPTYRNYQNGKSRNWYTEGSLNYSRSFGLHTISALALYNQSKEYYIKGDYSDIARTYVGFVSRVTYDWNNRYMAEVNFGYNGSENFAPGKRFGSFPAGSIGWVVSDEPFFKSVKKYISFLKLRASWGLVGNDKIGGSRFLFMSDPYNVNQTALWERAQYSSGSDSGVAYAYLFGVENGTATKGAYESAKNNPDVTWEKAFKQDYGFDMNFFDDRLRTTFDYYMEHRTDILAIDYRIPTFIGFTPPYSNFGVVDSHGWEVSVNWQDKIGKDFRYSVKLNLSYNFNEIIEDRQAPQQNDYMYTAGHRIGSRLQYLFWKLYYPGAEADYEKEFGSPFPTQLVSKLYPGDPVYVDLDGNGYIDPNDQSRDFGYTDDPQYIAGLNLALSYKNLSVSAQFTGAWNVSRVLGDVFQRPFHNRNTENNGGLLQYHLDNTWTPENPDPNAEYPRATWTNAIQNYAASTLWEKDAKYLRLKTLQIAYDFHFPFMKVLGLNQLQLSISGYNLFTLTPYKFGDPEARASSTPSYPLQRTYTASLKLGF
ncbi:MAG: TonB-dependent receptor [Prevotella sp.]|nr:TonB-dependent receptor [Prevotella sp.]